jgi:hypothetical protein
LRRWNIDPVATLIALAIAVTIATVIHACSR